MQMPNEPLLVAIHVRRDVGAAEPGEQPRLVNLAQEMGAYDWRLSARNVWKVEQMLIDFPHRPLTISDARYRALHARYVAFRAANHDLKPIYYEGRDTWMPLPKDRTWARR